jgi:glycosyltransferase involved in cell wall biosynthesis
MMPDDTSAQANPFTPTERRPMRIMHLVNHCGKANGHVNVSIDLACTQAKMGHTVGYVCETGDYIDLLKSYGVTVFNAPEPHRSVLGFLRANVALARAIRKFRPDILHSHMAAQTVLLQPYRVLGYHVVTTLHNEFDRSARLMGMAGRVVAVGRTGYEQMQRYGVSVDKIRLVQNGTIGSPRLAPSFQVATLTQPALLTICGMHPRKGVIDLLEAFASVAGQFPTSALYLAGEGPMLEEYKQYAETLGLGARAIFLGYREDPRQYLAAADIFILASHADPGPLVIGEARHSGCAIIATDVDGIPAMLDGGAAGLLVPPRNPARLAEAITNLLNDPAMLADYKAKAANGAERFRVTRVCQDMESVYAELL